MWNTDQNSVSVIWPDAENLDPTVFAVVMNTANAICAAYAPALPSGSVIPDSWKMAEILQAIHIWGQKGRGNGDTFGPDGLPITTYSLAYTARDILRPKTNPLGRLA